jgi:medium-chain acyl-[acyl-carrier-protein] hydrolase
MLTHSLRDPWFAYCPTAAGAPLRLFCFPYAGGAASIFRTWSSRLPQVDVYPIQYPGRENRLSELPFNRLEHLVDQLARVIRPYLDHPFAFFGHSLGGLVCFELARRLRREGGPAPQCLFVSGSRAPHRRDPKPPIHHLPDPEFVDALRRLEGTPEAVLQHAELMQLMMPILRSDFAVIETYRYAPALPLDCPISAFGGTTDGEVGTEEVAAWRDHTAGAFQLRLVPGNHFFSHTARDMLLQALSQDLARLSGC